MSLACGSFNNDKAESSRTPRVGLPPRKPAAQFALHSAIQWPPSSPYTIVIVLNTDANARALVGSQMTQFGSWKLEKWNDQGIFCYGVIYIFYPTMKIFSEQPWLSIREIYRGILSCVNEQNVAYRCRVGLRYWNCKNYIVRTPHPIFGCLLYVAQSVTKRAYHVHHKDRDYIRTK